MIEPGKIVYTDIITNRIARISDMHPLLAPAELDDLSWYIYPNRMISEDMKTNTNLWENTPDKKFVKHSVDIKEEDKIRLRKYNDIADCLEQLSRLIGAMRYSKRKNHIGWDDLVPQYQKEIEEFKSTGKIGTLLRSLSDTEEGVTAAIAEFEINRNTYLNFLVTSETYWNKWSRKIKQSSDPYNTLLLIKNSVGIIK